MNCSQLYIGVNEQIDESRSDIFSVKLVPSASSEAESICTVLGCKYIYYLAPHTGCGCGWDFLEVGTPSDALSRHSCEALGRFLRYVERSQSNPKIYSVCIDSVGTPSHTEQIISSEEFMLDIDKLRIVYASPGARVYVLVSDNLLEPTHFAASQT